MANRFLPRISVLDANVFLSITTPRKTTASSAISVFAVAFAGITQVQGKAAILDETNKTVRRARVMTNYTLNPAAFTCSSRAK